MPGNLKFRFANVLHLCETNPFNLKMFADLIYMLLFTLSKFAVIFP